MMNRDLSAVAMEGGEWSACVEAVIDAAVDRVWLRIADFGCLEWTGLLHSCTIVHGTPNSPGCIRLVRGGSGEKQVLAYEKLLEYNAERCSIAYEVLEHPIATGLVASIVLSSSSSSSSSNSSTSSTRFSWSCKVQAAGDEHKRRQLAELVIPFYQAAIRNLKAAVECV